MKLFTEFYIFSGRISLKKTFNLVIYSYKIIRNIVVIMEKLFINYFGLYKYFCTFAFVRT